MDDKPKHSARRKKSSAASVRDRQSIRRATRWMAFILVVVIAFCAGFFVRSQSDFMASLGFPVEKSSQSTGSAKETKTVHDSVSMRIAEVEDLLSRYSLDSYDLETSTYGMVDAMMKSTGDPYATYYTPERYAAYVKEAGNRDYSGIGVLFAEYNGRAYAVDVFQGSEAEAKGVRQGDFVVAVDGDSSKTWSMAEVVKAVSRQEGQSVVVTWMRPTSLDAEKGSEFTTMLTCQKFDEQNVTTSLDDTVGTVKIRQITQNSARLVEDAVRDLLEQGATSFVIDLRDNPGGYLTQAVDIASLFVQSGVLVQVQGTDGVSTKTASGVTLTDAPLVVLVNSYTSSAAEVLACALQDNQRAEVVGQTTMGKGSVQVMRELSFGGAIRYTAAYYLSPLGHDIDGIGVVPDVSISNGDDEVDTQMLIAQDTARSLSHS